MYRFSFLLTLVLSCFNLIQAQNKAIPFESKYFKVPDLDDKFTELKLLATVGALLEAQHYSPKVIDDNFSKKLFMSYLFPTGYFK
jgi:hypothetical protein